MTFSKVIGQERVVGSLKKAIESGRVAHAYVFYGPDGVGKRAAALAMAAALQCDAPSGGESCGTCGACHKASKGLHPDVHVMMPTTKEQDLQDVGARLRMLAEDPYQRVDYRSRPNLDGKRSATNKQVHIFIDHVNNHLRKEMSYHSVEGKYRVAILLDADLMRVDAANALLKLLEEPGNRSVLILVTNRIDHLLPTILSRCQQIRFDTLSTADVERALLSRGIDASRAATLSRMADGSIGRAIDLASNEDLLQTREEVLEFLRVSYQGKGNRVVSAADAMSRPGREYTKFQLLVLLGLLRDLILIRASGNTDLVVNIDQAEALLRFSSNLPDANLENMVDAVEETAMLVERNINLRLALISLSRVLSRSMRGEPGVRMVTDLLEVTA